MASPRVIAWLDRIAWILIYGGLFAFVLGIASGGADVIAGWSLGVVGGVAVAAGGILIWVRSRLDETGADGARQDTSTEGKQ